MLHRRQFKKIIYLSSCIEDNSKKLYTCQAENNDESDLEESIAKEMENNQNDVSNLMGNDTSRISLATITVISQP
jgi:hypothetical protein